MIPVVTDHDLLKRPSARALPTLAKIHSSKRRGVVVRVAVGSVDHEIPKVRRICVWPDASSGKESVCHRVCLDGLPLVFAGGCQFGEAVSEHQEYRVKLFYSRPGDVILSIKVGVFEVNGNASISGFGEDSSLDASAVR